MSHHDGYFYGDDGLQQPPEPLDFVFMGGILLGALGLGSAVVVAVGLIWARNFRDSVRGLGA